LNGTQINMLNVMLILSSSILESDHCYN